MACCGCSGLAEMLKGEGLTVSFRGALVGFYMRQRERHADPTNADAFSVRATRRNSSQHALHARGDSQLIVSFSAE